MCFAATVTAVLAAFALRGAQRRWAIGCGTLLGAALVFASRSQADLRLATTAWDRYGATVAARGTEALRRELEGTALALNEAARTALDASGDRQLAFATLGRLARGPDERGVVLYRQGTPIAWAGRMRSSPDEMRNDVGVAVSSFYLTLYVTATRGPDRAVATALIDAAPPGDALAEALARRVALTTGVSGFQYAPPRASPADAGTMRFIAFGRPVLDARPSLLPQGEAVLRLEEKARIRVAALLAAALACFIIAVWRGTRALPWRLATLGAVLACTALVPLNEFSNYTRLFDAGVYYAPLGGPLTASAGALGITSALALLALLALLRRHRRRPARWAGALVVLLVAGLGPFLLRDLARGVQTPPYGASAQLWLMWEVPVFLAAVSALLAGAVGGSTVLGRSRGIPPAVAPALAAVAALVAPVVWQAPGQWPWWYTFVWIAAVAALALSRQTRYVVLTAATVAALGATALVWGRTAKGRVALAERDLSSLTEADPNAKSLLDRLGAVLATDAPPTREGLLQQFASSALASAGYPTALFAWPTDSAPAASFRTASFMIPLREVARAVGDARRTGRAVMRPIAGDPALELLLAVPGATAGVTAVVVAPKTRLIAADPFTRLLGIESDPEGEPPYTLQLSEPAPASSAGRPVIWRRDRSALHGDTFVRTGGQPGASRAHVDVDLRPLDALVQRGALIALLDLGLVGGLWLLSVLADGGVGRWLQARRRTMGRSYRARLTVVLFAFFVMPAVAFAVWSYRQLAADATQSRELLVRETLRAVAPADTGIDWLSHESDRLGTPLFLYRAGELAYASDPLYEGLAPTGRFLDPAVDLELVARDEVADSRMERVGAAATLFGYRAVRRAGAGTVVLGAAARVDELSLDRRRRDLGILVLFATALGALAALWLSGIAARQLARPIATLREAALALAAGERSPPLEAEPTIEFHPVFTAFRRMAADLNTSRSALEEAQRQTAAVLRNVASGVIAVDADARVAVANPRAESLLDGPLPPGTPLETVASPSLIALVHGFLLSGREEDEFELESGERQVRGRLTRLARGGAVITIDDVTALARAQRVLAWGEMARQVAHEIKNPLTPIRLGVQHLKRARADPRVDFDRVLEQNVTRILTEIDRLDEIARAFSRYGSPPDEREPAIPTDVAAVVRDVVGLETMDEQATVHWTLDAADGPMPAMARGDELRDVLLNVLENARLANASNVHVRVGRDGVGDPEARDVVITVEDDGHGIPDTVLPRVFEPHFSTRTSGSGLGLAISRQIVDGWGGGVSVTSTVAEGTTVRISLKRAPAEG